MLFFSVPPFPQSIWWKIQMCEQSSDLVNENRIRFSLTECTWTERLHQSTTEERQNVLQLLQQSSWLFARPSPTKGDLIFSGSNQKVKRPEAAVDASTAVKFSCPRLPRSQGTKSWESQVISSLGTNSALRHHLHMTLIPHLSAAQTCPALMANISTYLAPWRPRLWPSGPIMAEQHQSCGQIALLHHKMNHYQLARVPTSLRFHLL